MSGGPKASLVVVEEEKEDGAFGMDSGCFLASSIQSGFAAYPPSSSSSQSPTFHIKQMEHVALLVMENLPTSLLGNTTTSHLVWNEDPHNTGTCIGRSNN